jgi:hypothetical protein
MSDRKFFVDQIMRLSGLDFFPVHQGGAKELVDALVRFARGESVEERQAHAVSVVDFWLYHEEQNQRPTPAEIKRICAAVPVSGAQLPPACSRCADVDFIVVERNGLSATTRCACPRGRRLRQLDAERYGASAEVSA